MNVQEALVASWRLAVRAAWEATQIGDDAAARGWLDTAAGLEALIEAAEPPPDPERDRAHRWAECLPGN